ncbi:MAG TPA: hypothetical protein VHJ76_07540 [Actinomycetota bacterium]|nr:hypothetical protein [Actinomycetota bacterium]
MKRICSRMAHALEARGVAPESATIAELVVSVAAGVALAAGGAMQEPRLWLLVPSLGAVRFALDSLAWPTNET